MEPLYFLLTIMGIVGLMSILNSISTDDPMEKFAFDIGQEVLISVSGEHGQVIGRAEFAHSENSYFIRYQTAEGRATEIWWGESALKANVKTTITKN